MAVLLRNVAEFGSEGLSLWCYTVLPRLRVNRKHFVPVCGNIRDISGSVDG
jgi:hypothetical protein